MKRRDLFKIGLAVGTARFGRNAAARAPEKQGESGRNRGRRFDAASLQSAAQRDGTRTSYDADYIVVGSGAGGGTVAARLAEEGFTVLLLEGGADPREMAGGDPQTPGGALPADYDVPAFHPLATENDAMKWDFFVRHYRDDHQQRRDPSYREMWNGRKVDGVLYPRAGTLGGCTAHNAMILVYPYDSDWNQLADLTGDRSWDADRMRTYFERIENCRHRPFERFWSKLGINPSRHGWAGWLPTESPVVKAAFLDRDLRTVILESLHDALKEVGPPGLDLARLANEADPNDSRIVADGSEGIRYVPLTTENHQRIGTRERVLSVTRRHPDRLKIRLNALVTRVLLDDRNRAIGVEYLSGERLYRAHARPSQSTGQAMRAYAAREVILAGGAFNSPQLLMLSGIGPRSVLQRHGIPVCVDLPGVGRNLQDRYEVGVVNRMAFDSWTALEGATFTTADPQYREWARKRTGVYTSNGALLSVMTRSSPLAPEPDLFCFGLIGLFRGYFPGYSTLLANNPNCLTWAILKAHTNNTAGEVTLRSDDPRDPPDVTFNYFEEGNDGRGDDLKAVVEGIKLVRKVAAGLKRRSLIAREELPGDAIQTEEELAQFVRDHAWGHHASCTCRIGTREQGGVVTGDFKVHGTEGLRVVDASVFPRIPGFFIVSAVYMIAEKAADVIVAEARRAR